MRFKLQKIRKKRKRVKCRHRTPGCGAEFLSKIRCFPSICPGLTLVLAWSLQDGCACLAHLPALSLLVSPSSKHPPTGQEQLPMILLGGSIGPKWLGAVMSALPACKDSQAMHVAGGHDSCWPDPHLHFAWVQNPMRQLYLWGQSIFMRATRPYDRDQNRGEARVNYQIRGRQGVRKTAELTMFIIIWKTGNNLNVLCKIHEIILKCHSRCGHVACIA